MTTPRYSSASRHFHWLSALLVVLCYVLVLSRSLFDKGTPVRTLVMQGHFWFGIVLLALTIPRIINVVRSGTPPIQPPLDRVSHILAKVFHGLLYLFLLVQPLLGLLMAGFGPGKLGIPFTGAVIPLPFPHDAAAAGTLKAIHIWLGTAFYYVIGLHAAAAFHHHFIRKDDTLQRMLGRTQSIIDDNR